MTGRATLRPAASERDRDACHVDSLTARAAELERELMRARSSARCALAAFREKYGQNRPTD
jgi:hypothetical protein